jgi:hypothetical protein
LHANQRLQPWTVTAEQREGVDRYGKFIKQLILDGEPNFERECMPFLECAALKGQSLLPRMKDITMKTGWTKNRGAYLALGALISASVETIHLEFNYSPSATLMHTYFEIMLPKATCLITLVLGCTTVVGRPTNATPDNGTEGANPFSLSYSLLHKFTSLRKLVLEPSFATWDLLDIIGTLPNLRYLSFIGARPTTALPVTLPKTGNPPRKEMFGSLRVLRINANIPVANQILWLYLQNPPSSFSHLFIFCDPPTASGHLTFPQKICSLLLKFELVVRETMHVIEFGRFAVIIAKCFNLERLAITFTSFFRMAEPDIDILSKLQNLRVLTLNSQPRFLSLDLTQVELLVYSGPEPDIQTLSWLARALPRLRRLAIVILACDTRELRTQQIPNSFEQLEELEFGQWSFTNRCVDGFDEHDAAIYITALVPESARIKFSTIDIDTGDDPNWAQLKKDHHVFVESFGKRLNDYMNVRNSQTLRVTKRLDDSRG